MRTIDPVFWLMQKFHRETNCGEFGHWAECERLCQSRGYRDWEEWIQKRNEEFEQEFREAINSRLS